MEGGWPSFNLTEGELVIAFVRGVFVAALFSTFGACLFCSLIAPAALKRLGGSEATQPDRDCLHIALRSALLAACVMLVWLVLVSGQMADAQTAGQALVALPLVVTGTRFGYVLTAQALALLATATALIVDGRYSRLAATGFAGVAVLLQATHGHALAMHEGLLLVSQGFHLLAAGAWLGALLPLLIFVSRAPLNSSAIAAQHFSPLGMLCVFVLATTAAFQGWILAGGFAGLIGTAYGWVALFKLSLFALLLMLATLNYLRLAPSLARYQARDARASLVRSIAVEIGLGLLVVVAAALLSSLEPGMHAPISRASPGMRSASSTTKSTSF